MTAAELRARLAADLFIPSHVVLAYLDSAPPTDTLEAARAATLASAEVVR